MHGRWNKESEREGKLFKEWKNIKNAKATGEKLKKNIGKT
jgi:hypothetical protein